MASGITSGYTNLPIKSEFNRAVRAFKSQHGIKLKDLFKLNDPSSLRLRQTFWADRMISSYIGRPSSTISFSVYHPIFDIDKTGKEHNDYYEWKIYQLTRLGSKQEVSVFPFRHRVMEDSFYKIGINEKDQIFTLIPNRSKSIQVTPEGDLYEIREMLANIQIFDTETRFVISPHTKDDHATTIVSILEHDSDRILASIFINSHDTKSHHQSYQQRFVPREPQPVCIYGLNTQEVYDRLKEELAGETMKIDLEKRVAYLLDESYDNLSSSPKVAAIKEVYGKGLIDLIHNVDPSGKMSRWIDRGTGPNMHYQLIDRRSFPFIDASHHLQTARDDGNCGIYTYNLLGAILKLLENPEKAEKVYQLALHGSQDALIAIFREDLKSYLPQYYNADGSKKTEEELKLYHLQMHWDLGSLAAKDTEYLSKKGFL
jgi:hypothetical protein